jgi:tetratricopeptide (TPR) repeat protein
MTLTKISLWTGLIVISTTLIPIHPLLQGQSFAQVDRNPIKIADTSKPITAKDYFRSGNTKQSQKDYQGALADYNRSIQIDPNYADAYSGRGYLKATQLQDVRGGLSDLDRAVQLKPNSALAYVSRAGIKYERLKDRAGGIADLQSAAKIFQQEGKTEYYQWAIGKIKEWQQS